MAGNDSRDESLIEIVVAVGEDGMAVKMKDPHTNQESYYKRDSIAKVN
eukprot:CAMPEP_0170495722 /NCGR_PEP_ID=MMETSP0208-20121228/18325_1 /TAXON_ID=197538 /ORGANISM="Strombidium inclinatum, Strain S3" /LENGTH=47 /DNA_ID= /DNA_START= /DNA_END= /DNA_ORIENTATION=